MSLAIAPEITCHAMPAHPRFGATASVFASRAGGDFGAAVGVLPDCAHPTSWYHACSVGCGGHGRARMGAGCARPSDTLLDTQARCDMAGTDSSQQHRSQGFTGLLPFGNRASAGTLLGRRLIGFSNHEALVLGIPRGGVPVAEGVARELHAELDVAVARKLGAPGYPELAIGAIAADGTTWLDDDLIARLSVSDEYLEQVTGAEHAEAERRERVFRGNRAGPRVAGRTVIVVDDGLATGATMFAAVATIRNQRPHYVVVAAPVCTREAAEELREVADEVVFLALPEPFLGVAAHYASFPQLEDAEVIRMLEEYRRTPPT
jgi:predicted phosphoribosyltransferase